MKEIVLPKIKITSEEIDSFWYDLYGIEDTKK